jgi:hypothetical protein
MSTTTSLHAPGYEGEVELVVQAREIHRAECEQCGWVGQEHDEMAWKDAEEEAVEHFEECPAIWDDTEECDCPGGPEPRFAGDFCKNCHKLVPDDFDDES